jgi:transposase
LRSFLAALQGREKVRVVGSDLSSPYRSLIASYFPKAKIIADRFQLIGWRGLHPCGAALRAVCLAALGSN